NMPVKNVESFKSRGNGESRKKITFYTTPKMSTYLVYIGVGKFDSYSESYNGVKIRSLTVPGRKGEGILAAKYAKKFLSFYESYFGIKYAMPKLELVAIPDFAAGAMENWGAITFRETAMLADEKKSAISTKQRVAEVVAHEIAHQWFGDLTTMKWWDDLWLNESFATFMSYKAVNAVFPAWKFDIQYLEEIVAVALSADFLRSTHPINVQVNNPGEIEEVFDDISYNKGSSVLSMMEDFVGAGIFRKGLNIYLNKHMFSNASKEDLWNAIEISAARSGAPKPIRRFASFWVDSPGYPLVSVSKTRDGFSIKQERFLLSGKAKWGPAPIPLHYLTSEGKSGTMLFDSDSGMIAEKGADWIKLNYGQHGFYRVSYSNELLDRIGGAIKAGKLGNVDAWGVEEDLFSMARRGSIKASKYLDFISKYMEGAGYPAVTSVFSHLKWLYMLLYGTRLQSTVEKVMGNFGNLWLGKLGWRRRPRDTNLDVLVRSGAISILGMISDVIVLKTSQALFSKGKNSIDPDIRSAVYTTVAWNGGIGEFQRFVKLYNMESEPAEKIRLLQSLAFFRSKSLSKRALEFSESKYVRLQDSILIPSLIAVNPDSKTIYWPWLKQGWKRFAGKYHGVSRMLSRLVEAASSCSTSAELSDFRMFFSKKENRPEDVKRAILKARERIEANIRFLKVNAAEE
ncbi:MAG: M1 family aminopeptidase, partial [Candidatus Micrarchaeaceae archaeon]